MLHEITIAYAWHFFRKIKPATMMHIFSLENRPLIFYKSTWKLLFTFGIKLGLYFSFYVAINNISDFIKNLTASICNDFLTLYFFTWCRHINCLPVFSNFPGEWNITLSKMGKYVFRRVYQNHTTNSAINGSSIHLPDPIHLFFSNNIKYDAL